MSESLAFIHTAIVLAVLCGLILYDANLKAFDKICKCENRRNKDYDFLFPIERLL